MSESTHSVDAAGWRRFTASHQVGDVIEVDVVRVVPFGCFVRAAEGVDGLAPRDAWATLPRLGDRLPVRIAAVDDGAARFSVTPV
jgi:ribosomal protein S1